MPRYLAVLGAAILCYAALGAVLRILRELVDNPAALGLLVGAGEGAMMSTCVLWLLRLAGPSGAGRRSVTSGSPTTRASPPGR